MRQITRRTMLVGNWGAGILPSQVRGYMEKLYAGLPRRRNSELVLCASVAAVSALSKACRDSHTKVAAQDLSVVADDRFAAGESTAAILHDLNVGWVLLGHPYRRWYCHETDEMLHRKLTEALQYDILPLLCLGEHTRQDPRIARAQAFLQMHMAFAGLPPGDVCRCILIYAPCWACSTRPLSPGETPGRALRPSGVEAQEMCSALREEVRRTYNSRTARGMTILYGGSVDTANAEEYLRQEDIDGLLLGSASLRPESLLQILVMQEQMRGFEL